MRYKVIPDRGIVFEFDDEPAAMTPQPPEPQPIPDAQAVKAVEAIAAKQRQDLERCITSPIQPTTA